MARFDKLEFNQSVPAKQPTDEPRSPSARLEPTDWLERADQQRRSGWYENALKYYSRALEQDRSLVAGWLGQVQMLILLDEHPEAELWARKALELFPSHGDLMAGRAQALCRMHDLRRAQEVCDGAFRQQGQSAYRWMVRGEVLLAARQTTEAYCFDKAIQIDPDWLIPLEIALVYLYYHRPSQALVRARRAAELAPDQYYPWYVQGRCQQLLGFDGQARQSFQQCLDLCPGHEEARCRMQELRRFPFWPFRWLRRLLSR